MQESKEPTRAELLERCQALGLKSTGWKKEKMAAELDKFELATATSEDEGDEKPEMASSPDVPPQEKGGESTGHSQHHAVAGVPLLRCGLERT